MLCMRTNEMKNHHILISADFQQFLEGKFAGCIVKFKTLHLFTPRLPKEINNSLLFKNVLYSLWLNNKISTTHHVPLQPEKSINLPNKLSYTKNGVFYSTYLIYV